MSTITLHSPSALKSSRVDRTSRTIRGASIITAGEAKGHGFQIDSKMLQQVRDALASNGRTKVHLTHSHARPSFFSPSDGITSLVGHVLGSTATIEGQRVRADVELGKFAEHSPLGNMSEFLLGAAEESPESIGLSIVFDGADFQQNQSGLPSGRLSNLLAVDFTGDPGANVGLLSEKKIMPETTANNSPTDATASIEALKQRGNELRTLGAMVHMEGDQIEKFVSDHLEDADIEPARKAALAFRREKFSNPPINTMTNIRVGQDGGTRFLADMQASQMIRFGCKAPAQFDRTGNICLDANGKPQVTAPVEGVVALSRIPLREHCRFYLERIARESVDGMTPAEIVGKAFSTRVALAQGSSDFSNILADSMRKSFRQLYQEAPRTWPLLARRTTTPDFREVKRVAISTAPDLIQTKEGEGIPYRIFTDSGETFVLAEYKVGLRLTRRAIINDDLDAFDRIPALQANAASRLEESVFYAALLGTVPMSDGVVIFHADHNNLGSGQSLDVAGVSAGIAAMMRQTSLGGHTLDLRPAAIVVAPENWVQAAQLTAAATVPSAVEDIVPNIIKNLAVIPTARMASGKWILSASMAQADTAEVCFLESEPSPVLKQETEFDTDDVKFAVRHTVASKVIDYRGFWKNQA